MNDICTWAPVVVWQGGEWGEHIFLLTAQYADYWNFRLTKTLTGRIACIFLYRHFAQKHLQFLSAVLFKKYMYLPINKQKNVTSRADIEIVGSASLK